jgi:SOS-response transcriptional repressor LexA
MSMRTPGQIIRAKRRELGLTLQQVADTVRCAKSYLSTIENDRRDTPPSRDLLVRLETALRLHDGELVRAAEWQSTPDNVRDEVGALRKERHLAARLVDLVKRGGLDTAFTTGELHRLVDRLSPPESGVADPRDRATSPAFLLPTQVPVINRVAAGYPREFTDLGYPARVADDYVSVPDVYDADAFAARVVGDSMEPAYREGDIVVFSPAADTTPGSDCFVRFDPDVSPGSETTFKRIYFETAPDGRQRIRLQPLNPAYPPSVVDREAVAGLYAAVYVVRPVGK